MPQAQLLILLRSFWKYLRLRTKGHPGSSQSRATHPFSHTYYPTTIIIKVDVHVTHMHSVHNEAPSTYLHIPGNQRRQFQPTQSHQHV